MKLIFRHLKDYKFRLFLALLFKSLAAFADLMIPFLIAYMIDTQIPQIENDYTPLYLNGIFMVFIALVGWLLNIIANRMSEYTASKVSEEVRKDVFFSMFTLSQKQVDHISKPSLISRMTTDTYNIYRATAIIQRLGIRAPILLLGGIILSFQLDPILTLVLIIMFPFVTGVVYYGSLKGVPLYAKNQSLMDQLIRKLREFIQGSRVVRALSMHDYEIQSFSEINKTSNEAELYANKVMSLINPIMTVMMNTGLVIVLILGAFRLSQNQTQIGAIMAFITYFTIILNAMMGITRIFVLSSRASASAARIEEVIKTENDMVDGDMPFEIKDKAPVHIEFKAVSFSYVGIKNQLTDISFTLKKGQSLGIIGPTGSGKTTLIKLLNRFYDPSSGEILIYGQNIKTYQKSSLRSHIATVLQHDMIFHDTIQFNITLDKEIMPLEKVIQTAQASFIYDKTLKLDEVLNTHGTNVSGGQKQRILLARALHHVSDILILDDATSALDYETDQKFRHALNEHYPDITKIIVAQRIASIKDCDLIIYVDHGKIKAMGSHETLLQTCDAYQLISKHQLGGELS
jgi:ATP-binding cassette subfamily B protein